MLKVKLEKELRLQFGFPKINSKRLKQMSSSQLKIELAETIRHYNSKGWSPATSTNYSIKDELGTIWVSKSGIDKAQFDAGDFITITKEGIACGEFEGLKPSAETLIHCALYELFPETTVILHSHSVYPVLISSQLADKLIVSGYEIQKGFEGQTTHDNTIEIPIFDNTQDITAFAKTLFQNKSKIQNHTFLMRKHGTYAWGRTLFEAKRHLETLEYLCQCEWMLRKNS
jgi:methylthioribulose-1-phosphate dehydratase